MRTTARFIFSATIGLGLAAFVLLSSFIAGANAPATVIAFALLAIYGLIEIAILSYSGPRFISRRASTHRAPRLVTLPAGKPVRVRAMVEMPQRSTDRRAA